tara:strand:+ start:231 stop:455 length:225 start_codon:yes stop_codon:yes gene_type:complete
METTKKTKDPSPALPAKTGPRMLTAQQFQGLAEVPAMVEWLANTNNPVRKSIEFNILLIRTVTSRILQLAFGGR